MRKVCADRKSLRSQVQRCVQCDSFFTHGGAGSECFSCSLESVRDELDSQVCDLLHGGHPKIVDVRWLLSQEESYIIQRCQTLPPEAFVSPEEAALLCIRKKGLIVVSYPWLTVHHPDPGGHHMRFLRQYLTKHVDAFTWQGEKTFGLFWDYASLPQPGPDGTMSVKERQAFKRGLEAINLLYGSMHTVVVQLTDIPTIAAPTQDVNLRPYSERGWCIFEATIASIMKPPTSLIDLGSVLVKLSLANVFTDWWNLQEVARAKRTPLVTPPIMASMLAEKQFTNGADREVVNKKYCDFFATIAPIMRALKVWKFPGADDWDDAERQHMIDSVPAFHNTREVFMTFNRFSDDDLAELLSNLATLRHLRVLDLSMCKGFSGRGFQALAVHSLPTLRELKLCKSDIDDLGLCLLADGLAGVPELRILNLSQCSLPAFRGFKALVDRLPMLRLLEELWLGHTSLDDRGLLLLLNVLPSLEHFRRLDLRGCPHITVVAVAALTRYLPQLPEVEPLAMCVEKRLTTLGRRKNTRSHSWYCKYCWQSALTDSFDLTEFACEDCINGVLWLPSELENTPEGVALVAAWEELEREDEQLRWC